MMRERQNIKNNLVEKVGVASCLLVLLLAFLAVNPVGGSAVFAEELEEGYFEASFGGSDDADDVATLNASGESTVGISFSPAIYYANLSPTNSAGQSARIDLSATVNVYQSNGYAVYLKSNSPNLVGVSNSSNVIPSATTAKTYANMDVNTWGYASSVGTAIADSATYKAVGVSGNGDKLAENINGGIVTDSKTINLSFATKINDQKPADTYRNTMIMSVVSSPLKVADDWGITEMQLMTSAICTNAKDTNGDGEITTQLKDTRDGKYYWVNKLADGKCWMTQNLDLDLSTATTLTNANTDLQGTVTSYKPAYSTVTTASSSTILDDPTGQRSWSLGNYRIINPTISSLCGVAKTSAADCPGQFTTYATPTSANGDANAHYILGNHYQWNAATAGTGGTITSETQTQASSSICPKGWKLPESGDSVVGTFQGLINAGSIGTSVAKLTGSPYYFVRSGIVFQDSSLFSNAGDGAGYLSSVPMYDTGLAYGLVFYATNNITASDWNNRQRGCSVRCIAR